MAVSTAENGYLTSVDGGNLAHHFDETMGHKEVPWPWLSNYLGITWLSTIAK